MIVRYWLRSRASFEVVVVAWNFHEQVVDQKIQSALAIERQAIADAQGSFTDSMWQRVRQVEEKCDVECNRASSALMQLEEERRARMLAEAEVQCESTRAATIQLSLSQAEYRAEEQSAKVGQLEGDVAAIRRELQETKEALTAATVQQ